MQQADRAGSALIRSTDAWSMATGSRDATMPMSRTMGASLAGTQSQAGETLVMKLM